ncbi:MAG: hypothetical protein RJB11_2163 [Planctomycetota bacterium]
MRSYGICKMHRSGLINQDSVVNTELAPRHLQASMESTIRSLGLDAFMLVDLSQQESTFADLLFATESVTFVLQQEVRLADFLDSFNTA